MLVVYEYNIISSINGLALEFKTVYMKIILENRQICSLWRIVRKNLKTKRAG